MARIIPLVIAALMIIMVFSPSVSQATPVQDPGTRTPIKHVVEIIMENHAFDNFFGVYPYMNGFSGGNPDNLTVPLNLLSLHNSPIPGQMKAIPNGTYSSKNPVEGYVAYHGDWNHGLMNGFVNYSGPQSMSYFTSSQIAPLWDLAEEYSLADNYFASVLSETTPNRLYNIAGFSPVINDYGPPPYVPFNETIFGELQTHGISWAYYDHNSSQGSPTLNFISGIGQYSSSIRSWSSFYSNLSSGNIPPVSYLMPVGGGENGYDMGSPENVLKGEMWLWYTIDSIMSSPAWNSTAIFLTFDEGGGFYDQVAPPILGGHQLGQRVPMIMISPYAKEDYISHTEMNHASVMAFIDYNWNLPALNRFVSLSNIPLDMFNFNLPYRDGSSARSPFLFLSSHNFTVPSSAYFTLGKSPATVANLFPMKPQIPFNQLNYSREGSSDFNLSQVSSSYYVSVDSSSSPFYTSPYLMVAIAVLDVALVMAGLYTVRRRR